jgi:hypothetical protein
MKSNPLLNRLLTLPEQQSLLNTLALTLCCYRLLLIDKRPHQCQRTFASKLTKS